MITKFELSSYYGVTTRTFYNYIVKMVKSGQVSFSVRDYSCIGRGNLTPSMVDEIRKHLGEPIITGTNRKQPETIRK